MFSALLHLFNSSTFFLTIKFSQEAETSTLELKTFSLANFSLASFSLADFSLENFSLADFSAAILALLPTLRHLTKFFCCWGTFSLLKSSTDRDVISDRDASLLCDVIFFTAFHLTWAGFTTQSS